MKKRYFIRLVFCSIILIITIVAATGRIEYFYLKLFNKSGIVEHYNSKGKIEGKRFVFDEGKIISEESYVDGRREGSCLLFYSDGQIREKAFYKHDKLEGIYSEYFEDGKLKLKQSYKNDLLEGPKLMYYQNGKIKNNDTLKNDRVEGKQYAFYESGNVKNIRFWRHDKLYGSENYYYENGKLEAYHTYDITGDKFYIERYDIKEDVKTRQGYVFSNNIYSITGKDSAVVLATKHKYDNIKDLYITIATPPKIKIAFQISINNKFISGFPVHNNTMKIENVFDKPGIYKIEIMGKFFNNSNPDIKEYGIESTIIKN